MEIISLEFMYFVLAALAVYYVLPGKLQNAFLLIASYYFYVLWSWKYAVVLVVLTIFNYTYAHLIKGDRKRKQVMLQIGVGVNLLVFGVMLFGYKLEPGLNQILSNLGKPGWVVHILVPLGFSYAVLECISYLVDVNRKLLPAHRNLVDFGLYLVYFPKMISGPIARAKTFLPMLQEAKSIDNQIVTRSIGLVLTGLLRSIVFAGMLAMLSPDVYSDPERYSNTQLALDMLAFGFILYNQFAGYTNIVRGVSGLFGLELARNFRQPFFSQDFSDFWTRWHISLSQWLRDYVYMPVSRSLLRRNPSRTNKANLFVPPLATMLASGLWHGASLNLVLWGAINGGYVVGEQILSLFRKTDPSRIKPLWQQILAGVTVVLLGTISAVPFRYHLGASRILLARLVKLNNWEMPDWRIFGMIGLSLLLDGLQQRSEDELFFLKLPNWVQGLLMAVAVLAIFGVNELQSAVATFVYP